MNSEKPKNQKSIVMVDDNNDNQKLYKALFNQKNYKFTFINSSLTFLEKLHKKELNQTSIIILDYNIDEHHHGIDLLIKIRKKNIFIPTIIFSSTASEELKKHDFSSLIPVFYLDKIDYGGKKLINFCESILFNIN
mgnify:CR=1 FL=1